MASSIQCSVSRAGILPLELFEGKSTVTWIEGWISFPIPWSFFVVFFQKLKILPNYHCSKGTMSFIFLRGRTSHDVPYILDHIFLLLFPALWAKKLDMKFRIFSIRSMDQILSPDGGPCYRWSPMWSQFDLFLSYIFS